MSKLKPKTKTKLKACVTKIVSVKLSHNVEFVKFLISLSTGKKIKRKTWAAKWRKWLACVKLASFNLFFMSKTDEIHFTKLEGREIFLNTDAGNNEMLEICTYSPAGPGKGGGATKSGN